MRQRLADRFGEVAARSVTDDLLRSGLLDDVEAARSLRRKLERSGPVGCVRLQQALERSGIDAAAAGQVLSELADAASPLEAAIESGRRTLGALRNLERSKQATRLARRLQRRGFDAETVEAALEQLGLGPDASEYHLPS